ncbi:hypothetical protein C2W59_01337 [Bacillus pumilus]|nr:hypothetical protein C2W59_01337 [Bacillus pumilus]
MYGETVQHHIDRIPFYSLSYGNQKAAAFYSYIYRFNSKKINKISKMIHFYRIHGLLITF